MTEKNYNPEQREKKSRQKAEIAMKPQKEKIVTTETKEKVEEKKVEEKVETKEKVEEKKKTKPKVKRTEAIVNSYNLPISTKKSSAICKFIKGKTIENAQSYLEQVVKVKKAIPMKGEIPHRKGKMMSGRFPVRASKHFIILLKSLAGNANVNEIDNPVIVEAYANIASLPYGRFGAWRRKRTNVKIVAREKKHLPFLKKSQMREKKTGGKK